MSSLPATATSATTMQPIRAFALKLQVCRTANLGSNNRRSARCYKGKVTRFAALARFEDKINGPCCLSALFTKVSAACLSRVWWQSSLGARLSNWAHTAGRPSRRYFSLAGRPRLTYITSRCQRHWRTPPIRLARLRRNSPANIGTDLFHTAAPFGGRSRSRARTPGPERSAN